MPEQHHPFSVAIPSDTLLRARRMLTEISKAHFHPSELCLTVSAAAGGGLLSAIQRGTDGSSPLWWIYFGILPAVALAGLVAYLFLITMSGSQPSALAKATLELLPDPGHATPMFAEFERLAGTWEFTSTTIVSGKKTGPRHSAVIV